MKLLKTSILLLSVTTFFLASCGVEQFQGVEGDGNVVSETRSVSDFDEVSGNAGLNIILTKGDTEKVVVEADENLQAVITTTVKNGKLVISAKKNIASSKAKNVYVTFDNLEGVSSASGANVTVKDDIEAISFECKASSGADLMLEGVESEDFEIDVSSGADITIKKVTAGKADLSASSAGKITLSGSTGEVKANASSGADIYAFNLTSQKASIKVSSSGEVRLKVMEELAASASSGGDVIYTGNPRITKNKTSSGGEIKAK